MKILVFFKKALINSHFWITVIFLFSLYLHLPLFVFDPDKDLWFVSGRDNINTMTRVRVSLLLWRGADLSYKLGDNKSTLNFALSDKNKWLLEKFANYADDSEKKYAISYAIQSGDTEFIEFVKAHFNTLDKD